MSHPTDAPGDTAKQDAAGALLGLSPLLVLTTNVVDALGLAIAAFAALVTTAALMASIRNRFAEAARWTATMLAIGLCTSTIMLLIQAFAFDLHERIAFLVPIVITNWFVLTRLDAPSGRVFEIGNLTAAFGAAAALVIVGVVCEAIADSGFPLAAMPPAAFIVAGLLLAARNVWVQRA